MADRAVDVVPATVAINRSRRESLYQQLYDGLREAIISGRLAPGVRLPPTRTLARELGIARNTVLAVYEQLYAEGYVRGRPGSGTYVSTDLSEQTALLRGKATAPRPAGSAARVLSGDAQVLRNLPAGTVEEPPSLAFIPGLPAVDRFPTDIWRRLQAKHWQRASHRMLGYGPPAGYRPLREAIATYLGATRGVLCATDQVMIVAGTKQGLDIALRVLVNAGDEVWMESPGYVAAYAALAGARARIVPVPVDSHGLNVDEGSARAPQAVAAYVTPSHQFPLGVTMTVARRLSLLDWASRQGAWILEDDYDSEFRYGGRPVAAVQGLDRDERVIYMGSFSKVMFPSLRIGYLVVPNDLIDVFTAAQRVQNGYLPLLDQAVLTDFLDGGHFARHVRRMRALYAERRHTVIESLEANLHGLLELGPSLTGMHVTGRLAASIDDRTASSAARRNGVIAMPLSSTYLAEEPPRHGLVLGYAAVDGPEIRGAVRRLAAALEPLQRESK